MAEDERDDFIEIAALGAEMHLLFDRLTRRYGDVTLVQFMTLQALAAVHPAALEPREIARRLHTGSNYVTKLLDQLGDMGLVERHAHRQDRRRRLVHITAGGRALHGDLAPRVEALQARVMSTAFSPAERARMRELTARLRRALADTIVPTGTIRPGP